MVSMWGGESGANDQRQNLKSQDQKAETQRRSQRPELRTGEGRKIKHSKRCILRGKETFEHEEKRQAVK